MFILEQKPTIPLTKNQCEYADVLKVKKKYANTAYL